MEVDITEPAGTLGETLGLIVADLGRWLGELEERIERLEAASNAATIPGMDSTASPPPLRAA